MKLKHLFLLFLILICYQEMMAQPRCSSNFNPFESCSWEYLNSEFVFVGRVVSVDDLPKSANIPRKVIVEVEKLLKGELSKRAELFLDQQCYGTVVANSKYIFTAERVSNGNFTGLFSKKWSFEVQEYTSQEISEITNKIRSVIKKVKQPRIVGKVIQNIGNKNIYSEMRFNPLNNKLGYDPDYSRPLPKVVIVAQRADGQIFKTKTNSEGEYQFENLSNGEYQIYTNLPKEFTVNSYGDFTKIVGDKKYLKIDDEICSKKVNFITQTLGSLSGRILNISEKWAIQPIIYLARVKSKLNGIDIFEADSYIPTNLTISRNDSQSEINFLVANIPTGRYLLSIQPLDDGQVIYYPGIKDADREKATIIEINSDKPTNIIFKIP